MKSLSDVLGLVLEAGSMGVDFQRQISYEHRAFKADGSVVTEADRNIEDFLCDKIGELAPGSNFVTEERVRTFDEIAPLTFVIDPIDGTDNFSYGMYQWSISLGVLDARLKPIGGIVYAPRLDFLVFADFGEPARLGLKGLSPPQTISELTKLSGIVLSTRTHNQVDISAFPGKVTALGSAAIHLCMPAVYGSIVGTIQDNLAFAWDIAGAHAILTSLGCEISYFDGQEIDYSKMRTNGWQVTDLVVAWKPGAAELMKQYVHKIC